LANGDEVTATSNAKVTTRPHGPEQVRTLEDLREKIKEVRARVEEADKPTGPLGIFGLTTST
jgi:hypothetical protein